MGQVWTLTSYTKDWLQPGWNRRSGSCMITGTLKSKIDKLWLEFWASATLPHSDTGGYLCCHGLLLASSGGDRSLSRRVRAARRRSSPTYGAPPRGPVRPMAALARTPTGELRRRHVTFAE